MNEGSKRISRVEPDSIAWELEIESGDELISINDETVTDVFDYRFLIQEEYVELLVRKKNGEEWLLEVEKEVDEELGLAFENDLMDEYHSCCNHCVFCFIDQMPKGMRETLYFKDDDLRLSFLQGNYVTLTNMSDDDVRRIIRYHLAPINISFQTTNPKLRCEMLHNRFAGEALSKADALYEAGIEMNGQIVLCKGMNDKAQLHRSLADLSRYLPHLRSVSVVPVGLTKYRDGLTPLECFTKAEAKEVLAEIHVWQEKLYPLHGLHFVHASDEWYLLAEEELPESERYDGYLQLENGVGMLRLLKEEAFACLDGKVGDDRKRKLSVATGALAANHIWEIAEGVQSYFPGVQTKVHRIRNDFFGENITVSGLITGCDIINQLKEKELGEYLLLPCNMLRSGEDTFLDDLTVLDVEEALGVSVRIVEQPGEELIHAILGDSVNSKCRRRQIYEQTNSSYSGTT